MRRVLLLLALALANLTCSVNVLENFADKTSNRALYYDAQKLINDGDYDQALEKLDLITEPFASDRTVKVLRASAYGGKCGINFLSFVEALANMGTTRVFPFLLSHFRNATSAKIDACMSAESILTGIGAVSERTSDENMFLLVVAFAKIGSILAFYADSNADGTADAVDTAEMCTEDTAPPRAAGGAFTNEDIIQVGTGLALALEQLTALAGTINVGDGSFTDINAICTTMAGAPYNVPLCTMTTTASWTDGSTDEEEQAIMRSLIHEGTDLGLGICGAGTPDLANCLCAP